MTRPMTGYLVRYGEYDDRIIEKISGLFSQSFPKSTKFTKEYLNWQYFENPNGAVVSFNAWTEADEIVAHYAAIPIKMKMEGRIEDGLLSLNTATHPDHQGKGLFVRLATETYKYAREHGYKYVIGVANNNSTHGFLNRLGFDLISPLHVKVGWGNAYAKNVSQSLIRVYYDEEIIMWRLRCPEFTYTIKDGTIYGNLGIPFFRTSVAKVPENISQGAITLDKAPCGLSLYIGIGADLSGYYVNLPKFIKRSPFNLIFKDLTDGELPKLTSENIFFQLLDYDVA